MGPTADSVERPTTGTGPARAYDFEVTTLRWLDARPEELTAVVLDSERLYQWCPTVFDLIDRGGPDGLGMALRLQAKGFLPHTFALEARVVGVVPHRFMRIAVSGDFEGVGDLTVVPDGAGCRLELDWRLSGYPWLRPLIRVFHGVFIRNHDWVMRRTFRLLEREVRRRREEDGQVTLPLARFPHNFFHGRQRRRSVKSDHRQRRVWRSSRRRSVLRNKPL